VPVETPCFKVDEPTLEVQPGLSEAAESAGTRALLPSPLFPGELTFADDGQQRYRGQCIRREGFNLIVYRLMARANEKG
jgi:hemolysin activation/secretion protein